MKKKEALNVLGLMEGEVMDKIYLRKGEVCIYKLL